TGSTSPDTSTRGTLSVTWKDVDTVFTAAVWTSFSGSAPASAGFSSPPQPARTSAAPPAVAPRTNALLLTTAADRSGCRTLASRGETHKACAREAGRRDRHRRPVPGQAQGAAGQRQVRSGRVGDPDPGGAGGW